MFKYSHLSFFLLAGSAFAIIPFGNARAYDPSYEKAARATGGQYYNIKPDDLSKLSDAIAAQLHGEGISSSLLDAKINMTEQPTPFSLQVSEKVKNLTVTLAGLDQSVQAHLQLVHPSGKAVEPNDNGVTITHVSSADTITVIWPESGIWQVSVSGRGEAILSAEGHSEDNEANIYSADFVRENLDIHGGFFPLPSVPLPDSQALYSVSMLEPLSDAQFSFIRANDTTVLEKLGLRQHYPGSSTYIAKVTVPSEPFRLEWSGHYKTGQEVHFIYPKIYVPKTW